MGVMIFASLVATAASNSVGAASTDAPKLMTESSLIPAADAGIRLYVREKRPADLTQFSSDRILLIVHGATWQALHQTIRPTCFATAAPLGWQKTHGPYPQPGRGTISRLRPTYIL
jgi:hypothetical protein